MWMGEISKYSIENISKILVGNKSDLQEKRKVTFEEANELSISN